MIAGASVVDAAYFAQIFGRDFAPRLASWYPVAAPMLCLATLLNVANWRADTIGRLGLRVAWGLLAGYALFVGVLLARSGAGLRELVLAQGSFGVCACAALCAVAIFVGCSFGYPARSADVNRAAIRDWSKRS